MHKLQDMQPNEIDAVCRLITDAMSADEAKQAANSFDFHFKCKTHGLDDGRQYFTLNKEGRIAALAGLHHYKWGPAENVWLAWFAVHPDCQRQGIGRYMVNEIEKLAQAQGYRKLFVETYDHPDFEKARQFYVACGFKQVGEILQYLPDSNNMVVYLKHLV